MVILRRWPFGRWRGRMVDKNGFFLFGGEDGFGCSKEEVVGL